MSPGITTFGVIDEYEYSLKPSKSNVTGHVKSAIEMPSQKTHTRFNSALFKRSKIDQGVGAKNMNTMSVQIRQLKPKDAHSHSHLLSRREKNTTIASGDYTETQTAHSKIILPNVEDLGSRKRVFTSHSVTRNAYDTK